MFRFIVILVSVSIVIGCYPEQAFRPGPSGFRNWEKSGASDSDVKAQMLSCGYSNPYLPDKKESLNEGAKNQLCMFDNGYRFKDGFKGTCSLQGGKALPACVEYRKTHP